MTTSATITTPASPNDTVLLTMAMPAAVASEFQERAGTILSEMLRAYRATGSAPFDLATWNSDGFIAPFDSNHRGDEDAWDLPAITDTEPDRRAVCWAVDHWTDTGRSLAAVLINHPDGLRSRDIADLAGYSGGIPSAFRHIAGRLRAIDRAPFWFGRPETKGHERGQVLWANRDSDSYQVVRAVFEARYPHLLEG
ncbi:MAG TPA: hypothetical protein VF364_13050 [Candidatus Limnocylindria bacterium]